MKTKWFITVFLGMFLMTALPYTSFAQEKTKGKRVEEVVEETLIVESVDVANRLLTVKDPAGTQQTIEVPPEVKNLPQLKPGDRIRTRYKVALAVSLLPSSEVAGVTETASSATAPPGAKPGLTAQREVRSVVTVKAIDLNKYTLTFVDPKDKTHTTQIKDPDLRVKLKQLKPGDKIGVVFTEALAIDVQPSAK